ncbi:omega-amidase, chloroplastic-like isoform X2 [Salvia miltiorrhiza]|uniref:omega-amidase, chloroplastic-like isoform X2 n=1 Tax=Salvia miltiorrhiza TaxID=226208 RepID=UPI0025AC798D|nr:omega-amidase, chloroplastic-like isoform X2 [Salvia miltiorrhiza]
MLPASSAQLRTLHSSVSRSLSPRIRSYLSQNPILCCRIASCGFAPTSIRSISSATTTVMASAEEARVPHAIPPPTPPVTKFKIALCQLAVTTDKEKNIAHARQVIEDAAAKGAQLILLPEIWNSPYSNDSFPVYAEDIDAGGDASPSTAMLSELSRSLKITIVGGSIPERSGDRLYNTCCVFDTDGKLKAKHRKIHLFDIDIPGKMTFKESKTLTAGETPTIVDTGVGRIGIGICYDIRFQELAAIYAARGAHLLCYPGAFNMTTGPLHWELLQRARCMWQLVHQLETLVLVMWLGGILLLSGRTFLPFQRQRRGDLYQLVDVQRLSST